MGRIIRPSNEEATSEQGGSILVKPMECSEMEANDVALNLEMPGLTQNRGCVMWVSPRKIQGRLSKTALVKETD